MEVKVGKLGCGATVTLIKACSKADGQYVVITADKIQDIIDMAGELGVTIRVPISLKSYLHLRENGLTIRDQYFFDLGGMTNANDVVAISADKISLMEVHRHITSDYTSREL